jgi:hypothetical protein
MKQLITYFFLVISVSIQVQAQNHSKDSLQGTWYISMIGIHQHDTSIYQVPQGKAELIFGDLLEQKFNHTRFYNRNAEPYYIDYRGTFNHRRVLSLYKTEKARRKRIEPQIVEYLLDKDLFILIEEETAGISSEAGFPVYDKLTVLTRIYDSLSWNKHILGAWNYDSTKPFFDLKIGDTCRFTKTNFGEKNQLRFDLNAAFSTCKIKENPTKVPIQSNEVINGVIDGIYLRDQWISYRYNINLAKTQLTFRLLSSGMTFKIIELTDKSLILVKQEFQQ